MSTTLESPASIPPFAPDREPYVEPKRANQYRSQVAPRLQWNRNWGYCGETSFICAGLNFGQYCSQYTARALASPGMDQRNQNSQLLLGGNDTQAALRMRLKASEWDYASLADTPQFIVWAKRHLLAGHVPIIGVFDNPNVFDSTPDPQYDHIVPVVGFASDDSLDADSCHPQDVLTFSDNGLYGPYGDGDYQFLFHYEVAGLQGTRLQAEQADVLYALPNAPPNYGIAIEGVLDPERVCYPVQLSSDTNQEPPLLEVPLTDPIQPNQVVVVPELEKNYRMVMVPQQIQLTATVTLPDPNVPYNVYIYDDFDKVPVMGFNAARCAAKLVMNMKAGSGWEVSLPGRADPVWQMQVPYTAMSNETVIFRAVPASAP